MLKKKIKRKISPYERFPDYFGDEMAEDVLQSEALDVADENGEQTWLWQLTNPPSIFGRS